MNNLKPSQACVNIVKHFEGLHKLTKDGMVQAYLCPAGKWTIGYGSTKGVKRGMKITKERAEELLMEDLLEHGAYVNQYVKVPLTQARFDALTSFVYNLGPGNFRSSTLLKKINVGDFEGATQEFSKWNKARVDGVLQPLAGLTRRRTAEAALFAMDASVGADGVLQPQKPEIEAVKPLTKSKTMAGASIAGSGLVLTEVAQQLQPIAHLSDAVKYVFLAVTVLGIAIVAYARWKDHKDGIH